MPSKDRINWENRRAYAQSVLDRLMKSNRSYSYTLADAKKELADDYIFVSYRHIERVLMPYQAPAKQTSLFDTNQLKLNINP